MKTYRNDFDKSYKRMGILIYCIWGIAILGVILTIVRIIYLGGKVLSTSPQEVGQFFGNIVNGFEEVQK
jgi:hypothetical protein